MSAPETREDEMLGRAVEADRAEAHAAGYATGLQHGREEAAAENLRLLALLARIDGELYVKGTGALAYGPLVEGTWPSGDIRRAFVAGAAWWEYEKTGATMWPHQRDQAENEAERRYGIVPPPAIPEPPHV